MFKVVLLFALLSVGFTKKSPKFDKFLQNVQPANAMQTQCFKPDNGDSIYNYTYEDLKSGKNVSLSKFKNQILLIVNVASFCGYTYQYLQLNPLKEKYNDSLEIIAFPCNQFLKQEPGKNAYEIYNALKYVRPGYGFEPNFQLSAKVNVNGANQTSLYSFLKQSCPATRTTFAGKDKLDYEPLHIRDIRWNFVKFLIEPKTGLPYKRYDPDFQPSDLIKDINALKRKMK